MAQYVVPTRFTAIDAMSPTVRNMGRNMAAMVERANVGIARQERLFRRLTPGIGSATRSMLNYASAGTALAAVGYSGKAIIDYETSIASLSAVTGVGGAQLEVFKKEIVGLATTSRKSATDVAGSFEVIGSMMSQYLTDPKALRQIADAGITLSKASRQELVPTLQNLTSIMNQFDLKASQATDTVNRLTAGEIVGSLRTSEVAESLQEFGAGAYAANISLSESVALVEALAKQMKTDKIGVGARNILTVLDSAKGLQKRARKELRHAGVNMALLMDPTKTLSERLHELSKIQGNSVAITKVFGRENKTAGQVIFNQLGVFDEYLAKIKVTNEAQNQAATNSATLKVATEQLIAAWSTYISTNDRAAVGLATLKDGISYVTRNMDEIVSVGVKVIKFYALWKGAIIAQQIVTGAYTATLVVSRAVSSAYFLYDMVKYVAVTQGMTKATAAAAIVQSSFNAAIAANPIGLAAIAIVTMAGAIYLLAEREKRLTEQYKEKARLEVDKAINKETEAVKALVAQYWQLGMSIKQATAGAIRFRVSQIDYQRSQTEERIKKTQTELEAEKNKLYFADLLYGGGTPEVGRRSELASQLQAQQAEAKLLAGRKASQMAFAYSQVEAGNISANDLSGILGGRGKGMALPGGAPMTEWGKQFGQRDIKDKFIKDNPNARGKEKIEMDYAKLQAAFEAALKSMKAPQVNLSGSSGWNGVQLSTPSSY